MLADKLIGHGVHSVSQLLESEKVTKRFYIDPVNKEGFYERFEAGRLTSSKIYTEYSIYSFYRHCPMGERVWIQQKRFPGFSDWVDSCIEFRYVFVDSYLEEVSEWIPPSVLEIDEQSNGVRIVKSAYREQSKYYVADLHSNLLSGIKGQFPPGSGQILKWTNIFNVSVDFPGLPPPEQIDWMIPHSASEQGLYDAAENH